MTTDEAVEQAELVGERLVPSEYVFQCTSLDSFGGGNVTSMSPPKPGFVLHSWHLMKGEWHWELVCCWRGPA